MTYVPFYALYRFDQVPRVGMPMWWAFAGFSNLLPDAIVRRWMFDDSVFIHFLPCDDGLPGISEPSLEDSR